MLSEVVAITVARCLIASQHINYQHFLTTKLAHSLISHYLTDHISQLTNDLQQHAFMLTYEKKKKHNSTFR